MTSKSRFFRELSDYSKGPLESSYTATSKSTGCTMVAMDLAEGMAVNARFHATLHGKDKTKMYPGHIELIHPDGFVRVRYKDGDVEEKVDPCWVEPSAKRGAMLPCGGPAKHPRAQLPSSTRGTGIEESSDRGGLGSATAVIAAGLAAEAHVQPAPPEEAEAVDGCLPPGVYRRASTRRGCRSWVPVEAAEAVDQHPDDQTQPATATAPLAQASTEVGVGSRVEEPDGTRGEIIARNGAWLTMRADAGEERKVRRRSVEVIAAVEGAQALALTVGCEVAGGVVPSVPLRAAATEEPSASTEPAATADVNRHSGGHEVVAGQVVAGQVVAALWDRHSGTGGGETAEAAAEVAAAAARVAAAAARAAAAAAVAVAAVADAAVADAGVEAGESGGGKDGYTTRRKQRTAVPAVSDVGDATAKGGAAGGGAAVEAQAETKHHRRNEQPARIVECGFVEAPALLPAATCDTLLGLDRSAAVLISNARQLSVQGAELRLVESALERSPQVRQTVLAVFGTEEFIVPKDSLKVGGPRHAHPVPHARCLMQKCKRTPPARRRADSGRRAGHVAADPARGRHMQPRALHRGAPALGAGALILPANLRATTLLLPPHASCMPTTGPDRVCGVQARRRLPCRSGAAGRVLVVPAMADGARRARPPT